MSFPWNAVIYAGMTLAETLANITTAVIEAKQGSVITEADVKNRRTQTLKAFSKLDQAMGKEHPVTPDEGRSLLHDNEDNHD